ncbi:hypothetical protein D3C87_1853870 [compost metagenome]
MVQPVVVQGIVGEATAVDLQRHPKPPRQCPARRVLEHLVSKTTDHSRDDHSSNSLLTQFSQMKGN